MTTIITPRPHARRLLVLATAWADGCRRVVVTLDDGTTRTADFWFR